MFSQGVSLEKHKGLLRLEPMSNTKQTQWHLGFFVSTLHQSTFLLLFLTLQGLCTDIMASGFVVYGIPVRLCICVLFLWLLFFSILMFAFVRFYFILLLFLR